MPGIWIPPLLERYCWLWRDDSIFFQSVVFLNHLRFTEHGLLLPGRVPGYKKDDVKLLPSSTTKKSVRQTYVIATQNSPAVQCVAYTTFCCLWRSLLPSVVVMKPMSDLCWTYQKNSTAIVRASNHHESLKSKVLHQAEEHLRLVQVEWGYYKSVCDDYTRSVKGCFSSSSDSFHTPTYRIKFSIKLQIFICALFIWLCTAGTLPFRSSATWPNLFFNSKKVRCLWG